jgi:V8-like Glu-specific endopeptidase
MLNFEQPSLWLDRTSDDMDYAVVGPVDGRTRVLDATKMPYAAVCQVERDFGDGRFSGCTGFLIGPRHVMTAGHCLHSAIRGRFGHRTGPKRIRISLGRNGARSKFATHWAKNWFVPLRFTQAMDRESDYGIIELAKPVSAAQHFLPLIAPGEAEIKRIRSLRVLHIAGYPGDKPATTMWEHAERLDRHTARSLFYSVDTCPGHSGSAIWYYPERGQRATVIGVHVAGPTPHRKGPWGCRPGVPFAPRGMFNRGIRFTANTLKQVDNVMRGKNDSSLMRFTRAAT